MWFTFLFKMLTWYPYYVLFGFLRSDVQDYIPNVANSHASKAIAVIEKPLRFACWCVVLVHVVIAVILLGMGWSAWALAS